MPQSQFTDFSSFAQSFWKSVGNVEIAGLQGGGFTQWFGVTGTTQTEPNRKIWIAFDDEAKRWMAGETNGDHGVFVTKAGKYKLSPNRYVLQNDSGLMVAEMFIDSERGHITETGIAFTYRPAT